MAIRNIKTVGDEVLRSTSVPVKDVNAFNENMDGFEIDATGVFARIICHEMDHLDGVMWFDRTEAGGFEKDIF